MDNKVINENVINDNFYDNAKKLSLIHYFNCNV